MNPWNSNTYFKNDRLASLDGEELVLVFCTDRECLIAIKLQFDRAIVHDRVLVFRIGLPGPNFDLQALQVEQTVEFE